LTVISRNFQVRPVMSRGKLRRVLGIAAQASGITGGSVSFAFVDEPGMCRQHERFCGHPTPTDVLSFPGDDEEDPRYLGDVVVCADVAARQAAELGHSYRTELVVLALHGVLHLLGHDHTRDRGEMRRLEERLRPRLLCAEGP
jgi:probable rRNA maturation factor